MSKKSSINYVEKFEEKHNVKKLHFVTKDNQIIKFTDGRYYDMKDLIFDVDKQIEVGKIEKYSDIGRDEMMSLSFQSWHNLNQSK